MAGDEAEREPTLSPTTAVHVRGWSDGGEAEARRFGERVLALAHEYSRWLDLSRLSRIVLAADYRAAVAEVASVDGGANVATANEFAEATATALMSVEGGRLTAVLVVWTPMVLRMFDEKDGPDKRSALQAFVHELVHVDDQAFLDRTFPGGAMAAVESDNRHGALLLMVSPAQSEYSATSRTAMIEPNAGFEFLDLLERTIGDAVADVGRQRQLYRIGSISLEAFWPWVQERCRFIFQALGYAVGHADGILKNDRADEALKARFRARLETIEAMELGWLIDETRDAVRPIMEQAAWTGLDAFEPLIELGERLLNRFGLFTRLENEMLYVDVPLNSMRDF